jgi:spore germination cell wall hydrolase CwlJ-like protein
MRNNKAILDEAARSVRRTFVGSVAGTAAMLAVVGAAGAYGMPEKLTAHAFSAAMAKLNLKFPKVEQAAPATEQPVQVADNTALRAVSPVSDAAPEGPAVRTVPQLATVVAPPVAPVTRIENSSSVAKTSPDKSLPIAEMAPVRNPFTAADPEPAPAATASIEPRTPPVVVEERPLLSTPMVFEAPKPADAQVLTEMPATEVVVAAPPVAPAEAPKQVEKPAPVTTPVQQASLAAEPSAVDFPKSVMIHLAMAKPPLSPAQRLDLAGKEYDKAEKCLAQAVYFEARNEPARGQQAVAQVVLNRVFSPYYPKDVCSVVYQNAHRHLSCQFTFACDGKPESVNERAAWARANRIAKQTLDAKVWLPEVNKATHYHAAYVRPNWIRDMKVMVRYGLHTFYRPRNWGDGSNEAHWGTAANSVKPAAVAAAKHAATPAKPVAAAAAKKLSPRKAYKAYARYYRA